MGSLSSGSCLLAAGAIADVTDPKFINISGALLLGLSLIAGGASPDGYGLIGARAVQGISIAMCMPTSVALLTASFKPGRYRNIGFSTLGLAQPLGFSIGLVIGGFADSTPIGWRLGFYLCGAVTLTLALANYFVLPSAMFNSQFSWNTILSAVDWVGILISSTSLGCFSYIFAYVIIILIYILRFHHGLTI